MNHEELLELDKPDFIAQSPKNMGGPKVFLGTYGCQMNKLDSEIVIGDLSRRGYGFTEEERNADIVIYNTCSVRAKAENRLYTRLDILRHWSKEDKRRRVIGVMGCVAQQEKESIFETDPSVNFVVGTDEFGRVGEIVDLILKGENNRVLATKLDSKFKYDRDVASRPSPYQAFISVMRGCDKFCTYCVVPFTRGREISRPVEDILDEAKRLADDGVTEITLLGQRIETYGKNTGDGKILEGRIHLGELMLKVAEIDGLRRIRYITAHPKHFSREIFECIAASPKISPFLHMPAQSGSNKVLRDMNRGYTREEYLEVAAMAKEIVPDIFICSDWIVGFATESDADFEDTVKLMKEVRFGASFIFKYSVRPGTQAESLGDPIPEKVKKERNRVLLETQEEISRELNRAEHGNIMNILVEGPSKTNKARQTGRNNQNRIAVFEAGRDLTGQYVDLKITRSTPLTLFGELA